MKHAVLEGLELMVSAWPEPPSVKSAGARYGVQGTSAVSGIDTPEPISGIRRGRPSGRPYLICEAIDFPIPRRFPSPWSNA